jgi:REP element-mobilizing transposase RayT
MPAHLRFQPEAWMTQMVTTRCLEGQPLLRPGEQSNALIIGCFAHAMRRFEGRVELHHIAVMSNHYHALVSAEDQPTLSAFMCLLNGSLAKELGALYGVHGHFWHRRYSKHLILDESALIDAYTYLFANSVKEGLVEHPRDWPGVHGHKALCEGEPLEGIWINRTALNGAKRRAQRRGLSAPNESQFTERLTLQLTQPRMWRDVDPHTHQGRCRAWAESVAQQYAEARLVTGDRVLGAARILTQDLRQRRPLRPSPRPLCRAGCAARFAALLQRYHEFAAQYREASGRLRAALAYDGRSAQVSFPLGGVPLFGACLSGCHLKSLTNPLTQANLPPPTP